MYKKGQKVLIIENGNADEGIIENVYENDTYDVSVEYRGYTILGQNIPEDMLAPTKGGYD